MYIKTIISLEYLDEKIEVMLFLLVIKFTYKIYREEGMHYWPEDWLAYFYRKKFYYGG